MNIRIDTIAIRDNKTQKIGHRTLPRGFFDPRSERKSWEVDEGRLGATPPYIVKSSSRLSNRGVDSEDNSNGGAAELDSEDWLLSISDEGRGEGLALSFSRGRVASSAMMAGVDGWVSDVERQHDNKVPYSLC